MKKMCFEPYLKLSIGLNLVVFKSLARGALVVVMVLPPLSSGGNESIMLHNTKNYRLCIIMIKMASFEIELIVPC